MKECKNMSFGFCIPKRLIASVLAAIVLALTGCTAKPDAVIQEPQPTDQPEAIIEQTQPPQNTQQPVGVQTPAVPKKEDAKLPAQGLFGRTICVDAGHGKASRSYQEPVAPGASEKKPAFVSGTAGKYMTEEEVNLIVAKKLEKRLTALGAKVVMTRTTSETDKSNIDRAKMAKEAGAQLTIRLHADGIEDKSVHGISMLVPTGTYIKDAGLLSDSKRAGEMILEHVIQETGAKNRGISRRSDMTGFNWSATPVVLLEMGFMTNLEEETLLEDEAYQNKMVEGIVKGMEQYFS
jgi:N-acetylmuramoyl-L-alanine amidase